MGSFEETLGALLDAKLAPLHADVRALAQAQPGRRGGLNASS